MGKKRKNILKTLVADNQIENLYIPSVLEKIIKLWWGDIHDSGGNIEWGYLALHFLLFLTVIALIVTICTAIICPT